MVVRVGSFGECELYGVFVMEVGADVKALARAMGYRVYQQEHAEELISGKGKDRQIVQVMLNREVVVLAKVGDAVKWVFEVMRQRYGLQARQAQEELAVKVALAYLREGVLVAEAPTGVGKTLTYLVGGLVAKRFVPGDRFFEAKTATYGLRMADQARWRAGAEVMGGMVGIPLVVATATKALQDQIWEKDIPRLVELGLVDADKVVVLKGRNAYFCENTARKALTLWEKAEYDLKAVKEVEQSVWVGWGQERAAEVVQWVEKGRWNGEFDKLEGGYPKTNGLEVKNGECIGRRCEFYKRCRYMQIRDQLEKMDLVVTNQSLVLADLKLRGTTGGRRSLPVGRYSVVFDEGHHLISKGLDLGVGEVTGSAWKELLATWGTVQRGLKISRDKGKGVAVLGKGDEEAKCVEGLWEAVVGQGYVHKEGWGADLVDYGNALKAWVHSVFEIQAESRDKGTFRYSFKGGVPDSARELLGRGSQLLKGLGGELIAMDKGCKLLMEGVKKKTLALRKAAEEGGSDAAKDAYEEQMEREKTLAAFRSKLEALKEQRMDLKRALDRWEVIDYVKWVSWPKRSVVFGGKKKGGGGKQKATKSVVRVQVGTDLWGEPIYEDRIEEGGDGESSDWREGRGDWGVHISPLRAAEVLRPLVWDQCGTRMEKSSSVVLGGPTGGVQLLPGEDFRKEVVEVLGWLKGCVVVSATMKGTNTFDVYSDAVGLLRQGSVKGVVRSMEERIGREVFLGEPRQLVKSKVEVEYVEVAPLFDYSRSELVVHRLEADGSYPQRVAFFKEVEGVLPGLLRPLSRSDVGGVGGCVVEGKGQGVLVLSSSWEMLGRLEDIVRGDVDGRGVDVWVQGRMSHKELLEGHEKSVREGRYSILMGTSSLAEGLDLPREMCMHVVLVVLPFGSSASPVEEALEEVLGSRYFEDKALQDASVKLVQMTGRLIRSHEDWGRITVLDSRLVVKGYGAKLLRRLPGYQLRTEGSGGVVKAGGSWGGVGGYGGGSTGSAGWKDTRWKGRSDWKGPATGMSGVSGVGVGGEKWGLRDSENVIEAKVVAGGVKSVGKPAVAVPVVPPVVLPVVPVVAPVVGWLSDLGGVVGAIKDAQALRAEGSDGWEDALGVVPGEAVVQPDKAPKKKKK